MEPLFFQIEKYSESISTFLPVAMVLMIILWGTNFKREGDPLIGKTTYGFLIGYSYICAFLGALLVLSILPALADIKEGLNRIGMTPFSVGVFYFSFVVSRGYAKLGKHVVVTRSNNSQY